MGPERQPMERTGASTGVGAGVGASFSDRDLLAGIADQALRSANQRQGIVASQRVRDVGANTRTMREPLSPGGPESAPENAHDSSDMAAQAGGKDAALTGRSGEARMGQSTGLDAGLSAGLEAQPGKAAGPMRGSAIGRLWAWLKRLVLFTAFLCVLVLSLVAVYRFSLWLHGWLHTSPMFVTRHIDITGNVRLQRDAILHLGGLKEGDNVFEVSVAAVERRLRTTPWVEDVSVKRVLPDQFVIRLRERLPSFWVRRQGRLYYSNDRGEIIAPVESDNFMSLPILSIEAGCEDAIPYLSRLMRDIRDGRLPVEAGAIATVDVTAARGVELYLEDRELRLSLAPDDWNGNLQRLGATIGDLARRRELGQAREVRASRDSVWVVLRQPADQERHQERP